MKIKAQSIPKTKIDLEEILSQFCYYYQQYKYHEARRIPVRRLIRMLKTARKEQAKEYFHLTKIVCAPHTKNGSGVKQCLAEYQKLIEG